MHKLSLQQANQKAMVSRYMLTVQFPVSWYDMRTSTEKKSHCRSSKLENSCLTLFLVGGGHKVQLNISTMKTFFPKLYEDLRHLFAILSKFNNFERGAGTRLSRLRIGLHDNVCVDIVYFVFQMV